MKHIKTLQKDFEKFLDFENEGMVLEYRYQFRNMLVWPFIRSVVWNAVMKSVSNNKIGIVDNTFFKGKLPKLFYYNWFSIFDLKHNPFFINRKSNVLFLYNSLGNVLNAQGNYYNRIYDKFTSLYENTDIIENAPFYKHLEPRQKKVYYTDSIDIINLLAEKLIPVCEKDKRMIDNFLLFLKNELPFELSQQNWKNIEIELERYAKTNRFTYIFYYKLFRRIQPKVVIQGQGCDGNHMACKLKVLHDLKIITSELQHGLITRTHFAYNYSETIFNNKDYQTYMPDSLLTFGKYWENNMRIPIPVFAVGSANFNENIKNMGNLNSSKDTLLILPSDPRSYLQLVANIKSKLPHLKILIKVHPSKEEQINIFSTIVNENIKIFCKENIFSLFKQADLVIGDDSTALYEAFALGKKVYVWESEKSLSVVDKKIGQWFKEKEEIIELLEHSDLYGSHCEINPEDVFCPNLEENYSNFINRYIER